MIRCRVILLDRLFYLFPHGLGPLVNQVERLTCRLINLLTVPRQPPQPDGGEKCGRKFSDKRVSLSIRFIHEQAYGGNDTKKKQTN